MSVVIFDIENIIFKYDVDKNLFVYERCGFSFEDAIDAISMQNLLDILKHPNENKYPHQYILVIRISKYVYALPSVYDQKKNKLFLKTLYPSRKLTKEYL